MSTHSVKTTKRQGDNNDSEETLLTEKALRLSLSPPRCPPIGTVHHSVLMGIHPTVDACYAVHHQEEATAVAHSNYNLHSGIREGVMHLVYNNNYSPRRLATTTSHPHLSLGHQGADQVTRFLGSMLPLSWQNHVRDTGGFRSIFDSLVELSIPMGAVANPGAARYFLQLTRQLRRIPYGTHKSQVIEMFIPQKIDRNDWTGMVFFVHGGAWGSGKPWYYRLVALAFLELNMAVAIVGYRVYPDGDTSIQIQDLEAAQAKLTEEYPEICGPHRERRSIGFCVMGHSSGAHIALLMLVDQAMRLIQAEQKRVRDPSVSKKPLLPMKMALCDKFVGISGPYDISHHFDYEAARGVEELSPMKACNGYTREHFRQNSPGHRLQDFLANFSESESTHLVMNNYFPEMMFVHGIEDDTVPSTATSEAARVFRSAGVGSCEEFYAPRTGHQDAVMHLMLGGRVKNFVQTWLREKNSTTVKLQSKL